MKHTKGKWMTVIEDKSIKIMPATAWYNPKIDSYIGDDIAKIEFLNGDGDGNINAEADAKLISAAPDLLEACKTVLRYKTNSNGETPELSSHLRDELEEAIRKATE